MMLISGQSIKAAVHHRPACDTDSGFSDATAPGLTATSALTT
ncbi:hypothetical protein [Klebsiella variicola]